MTRALYERFVNHASRRLLSLSLMDLYVQVMLKAAKHATAEDRAYMCRMALALLAFSQVCVLHVAVFAALHNNQPPLLHGALSVTCLGGCGNTCAGSASSRLESDVYQECSSVTCMKVAGRRTLLPMGCLLMPWQ